MTLENLVLPCHRLESLRKISEKHSSVSEVPERAHVNFLPNSRRHSDVTDAASSILNLNFPTIDFASRPRAIPKCAEPPFEVVKIGIEWTVKHVSNVGHFLAHQMSMHSLRSSRDTDHHVRISRHKRWVQIPKVRKVPFENGITVVFYLVELLLCPGKPKPVGPNLQIVNLLMAQLLSLINPLPRPYREICCGYCQNAGDQRLEIVDEASPTVLPNSYRRRRSRTKKHGKQQSDCYNYPKQNQHSLFVHLRHRFPHSPSRRNASHFSAESGSARKVGV
jgi:hypothetical protein